MHTVRWMHCCINFVHLYGYIICVIPIYATMTPTSSTPGSCSSSFFSALIST